MDVFTDEQLEAKFLEIPNTHPRLLWEKVDSIALYLALTGTFGAALMVWKFLFENLARPHFSHADSLVAPEMFCFLNKMEDFIGGEKDLSYRVWQHDIRARRQMTEIKNARHLASNNATPHSLVLQAKMLARPARGERYSSTELEALPIFDGLFDSPDLSRYVSDDAHLLYADICYRHNKREEAASHLSEWAALSQSTSHITWCALAIPGLARLIAQKHLEFLTSFSREERKNIALDTIAIIQRRLREKRPLRSDVTSLSIPIFYSQFYLEAAASSALELEGVFLSGPTLVPEAAAPYPGQVMVGVPPQTGSATFHLKFGEKLPDLNVGVFVVSFPFRAHENRRRGELDAQIGNVFLNTAVEVAGDVGFEVPPGDYDVAAIFRRSRGGEREESIDLRHFDVDLWFLPRGSCPQFGVHYDRS